jgi:hypothetical protein
MFCNDFMLIYLPLSDYDFLTSLVFLQQAKNMIQPSIQSFVCPPSIPPSRPSSDPFPGSELRAQFVGG